MFDRSAPLRGRGLDSRPLKADLEIGARCFGIWAACARLVEAVVVGLASQTARYVTSPMARKMSMARREARCPCCVRCRSMMSLRWRKMLRGARSGRFSRSSDGIVSQCRFGRRFRPSTSASGTLMPSRWLIVSAAGRSRSDNESDKSSAGVVGRRSGALRSATSGGASDRSIRSQFRQHLLGRPETAERKTGPLRGRCPLPRIQRLERRSRGQEAMPVGEVGQGPSVPPAESKRKQPRCAGLRSCLCLSWIPFVGSAWLGLIAVALGFASAWSRSSSERWHRRVNGRVVCLLGSG